jgi:hypothetical protein
VLGGENGQLFYGMWSFVLLELYCRVGERKGEFIFCIALDWYVDENFVPRQNVHCVDNL